MAFKFPEDRWEVLLQEERRQWQDDRLLWSFVRPRPEEVWVDLGCGPGYFALPLAQQVRKVYAVDLSAKMVKICVERARAAGITHIEGIVCGEDRVPLPDRIADGVLLANVYHELVHPKRSLQEIRRLLKPGGRAVVLDWHPIPSPAGPPLEERVPREEVIAQWEAEGFSLVGESSAYPYHYLLAFAPVPLGERSEKV